VRIGVLGALVVAAAVPLSVAAASAQGAEARPMKGRVGVGLSIGRVQPSSAELSGRTGFRPSLRRLPAQGFGAAVTLTWFGSDVDKTFAATELPFGHLAVVR
jgi:hypothetical protein